MMNLYILTYRENVKQRWIDISKKHAVVQFDIEDLLHQKFTEDSSLLVHIDSFNNDQLDQIVELQETVSLIAFSDNPNDTQGIELLLKGFKGYINTFVTESIFDDLLGSVSRGDIWAGASIVQKMLKHMLQMNNEIKGNDLGVNLKQYNLSDREEETVKILITGAGNKEIGRELGITERTVKAHVGSILKKTDTLDRISLIIKLKDSNG
jgi:DNA-binding NarL/FixJ family response regulator